MVNIRKLKKSEVLIREGDNSDTLYWVQSGSLRLFKKKGKGFVELGVIHSGELVGEMSFIDNDPRSASVEAIQDCEIVEIPRGKFDEVIESQPSWLNSLIKTLVKRLRVTGNKIRELDSDNTVFKVDGKNSFKEHEFIHHLDQFKLFSGLLLACSRHGQTTADGEIMIRAGWLQIFGNQILNAPLSKVTSFTEVLQDAGVIRLEKEEKRVDIYVRNIDFLEEYLLWLNEENLKTTDKQLHLSDNAMMICDAIYAFGNLFDHGEDLAELKINLDDIEEKYKEETNQKIAFDWASFSEIHKIGIASEIKVEDGGIKFSLLRLQFFLRIYPFLSLRQRFDEINVLKRESTR